MGVVYSREQQEVQRQYPGADGKNRRHRFLLLFAVTKMKDEPRSIRSPSKHPIGLGFSCVLFLLIDICCLLYCLLLLDTATYLHDTTFQLWVQPELVDP